MQGLRRTPVLPSDPPDRKQDLREEAAQSDEFDVALPEHIRNQAKFAVKDEYTADFLELADEHSERQLQQALLAKVEPFVVGMGGMFSFVGSQYGLEVSGNEYFIDLLRFHRRVRLLVASPHIPTKKRERQQLFRAKCRSRQTV